MFNRSKILKVTTLWVGLFAASVQADNVLIKNVLEQTAKFDVFIPSTGFNKTFFLNPGETINPIGTDLWHNVVIYINTYTLDYKVLCSVLLTERAMPNTGYTFYLPEASQLSGDPLCKYDNGFPCDCFNDDRDECILSCETLTNAQMVIFNKVGSSAGHSELYRNSPYAR